MLRLVAVYLFYCHWVVNAVFYIKNELIKNDVNDVTHKLSESIMSLINQLILVDHATY